MQHAHYCLLERTIKCAITQIEDSRGPNFMIKWFTSAYCVLAGGRRAIVIAIAYPLVCAAGAVPKLNFSYDC